MWNLIRAETRKLATVRTPWVLAIVGMALAVLPMVLMASVGGATAGGAELATSAVLQKQFLLANAGIVGMILGVLVVGQEYRHGTIIPTVLAEPRRWPVVAAKAAVAALAGVALAVLTGGAAFATGVAVINAQGGQLLLGAGEIAGTWALNGLLVAGVAVVAAGVAAVLRNQTVALAAVLLLAFVAPLIGAAAPEVAWYLIPDNLSLALADIAPASGEAPFGQWGAAGILGGYVAAALAAGTALLARHDIA